LWKSRSDFQGAVGAVCASTVPSASTASVVGGARALAQTIAFPHHLDNGRVREEAIENRGCGRDVAEEHAPILCRTVGGNERRCSFVPTHKDLQEVLGRVRSELLHPKVFEHEQVDARELLDEIPARPRGVRFGEIGGQVEGAADESAVAGPNGADGDRCSFRPS
jgi:hypothetical protein